jgi:hypothetical protein
MLSGEQQLSAVTWRQQRLVGTGPVPGAGEAAPHVPLRLTRPVDGNVLHATTAAAAAENDPVGVPPDPVQHGGVPGHGGQGAPGGVGRQEAVPCGIACRSGVAQCKRPHPAV